MYSCYHIKNVGCRFVTNQLNNINIAFTMIALFILETIRDIDNPVLS